MYNTLHSAVGASVALAIFPGNWPAAFLLGLVSHFVLDSIPHGDDASPELQADRKRFVGRMVAFGTVDFSLLAVLSGIWLWFHGWSGVFVSAVVGSALPDVFLGIELLLGRKNLFGFVSRLHHRFHNPLRVFFSPWIGLAGQALIAGLFWRWLLFEVF